VTDSVREESEEDIIIKNVVFVANWKVDNWFFFGGGGQENSEEDKTERNWEGSIVKMSRSHLQ